MRSIRVVRALTSNADVARVPGSLPANSDTVLSVYNDITCACTAGSWY
jgi:hypothetical protein